MFFHTVACIEFKGYLAIQVIPGVTTVLSLSVLTMTTPSFPGTSVGLVIQTSTPGNGEPTQPETATHQIDCCLPTSKARDHVFGSHSNWNFADAFFAIYSNLNHNVTQSVNCDIVEYHNVLMCYDLMHSVHYVL